MIFFITKNYKIKYLRLFCFYLLIIINYCVYGLDIQNTSWLSIWIAPSEGIVCSFVMTSPAPRDFIQEYLPSIVLEEFPPYLLHYVHSRMELVQNFLPTDTLMQPSNNVCIKRASQDIYPSIKLPMEAIIHTLPFDFDFKIKYKKIKETEGKRLPPAFNYLAREFEIIEGFEAGETLFSYYHITPSMRLISHIALFEKWVTEKHNYEERYHLDTMIENRGEDVEKFTGTFKYALGWAWDLQLHHERKMSVEFLMQQKTNNQWDVQQRMLKDSRASGVLFDHWVLTFTLDF